MALMLKKAKTRRGKKFLESRSPKTTENDKTALIFKSGKSTESLTQYLADVYNLKNPLIVKLNQKNPVRLFEDCTFVERMSQKHDTSMFMTVSKSKSHPSAVIFGRLYDHQLLDMAELQLHDFKAASTFKTQPCPVGTKPCVILQGANFEIDENFKRIGSLLVDFFRGPSIKRVRLQGVELVITFTATDDRISMRTYRSVLKKVDSTSGPRVELLEIGPHADFSVDRTKFASDHLMKKAMKKPKELKAKPRKNVSQDVLGTQHGRIHVGRQNVHDIQTRKVKALKKFAPVRNGKQPNANRQPLGKRVAPNGNNNRQASKRAKMQN